jgi:hypothetical protein
MVLKIIPAAKSIKVAHMMGPVNKSYNDMNYLPVKFRMIPRISEAGYHQGMLYTGISTYIVLKKPDTTRWHNKGKFIAHYTVFTGKSQ